VTSLLTIQGCCQSMAYNLLLDWSTHLRVCRIRQIIDVICWVQISFFLVVKLLPVTTSVNNFKKKPYINVMKWLISLM
jgi:uncharacterized membrane protein